MLSFIYFFKKTKNAKQSLLSLFNCIRKVQDKIQQNIDAQIELFDKIYISVFRMRGIVAALVGLALHVNAQFALEVGPPSIHLKMFGKDLINVGKTKKHHNKKSKAHQRKKKSHKKSSNKPIKPTEPDQEIGNNLVVEENQKDIIQTETQTKKQVVQVVDIPKDPELTTAQPMNFDEESEVDSSEGDENTIIQNSLIKNDEAADKIQFGKIDGKNFELIQNQDIQNNEELVMINNNEEKAKPQPVVLLIKGAPMINLQTAEILDDPQQENIETENLEDKAESESEIEERMQEEENLRLAKMIKYMPESEKKHLRAMASNHAQN